MVARERSSLMDVSIVIAEDDSGQRMLLQKLVEGLGCEVVSAVKNGREAIEACSNRQISLVLMDLDMPEVDGLEAAEQIAALGIPVVLITGVPDATNLIVESEPIAACLRKPLVLNTLADTIARVAAR